MTTDPTARLPESTIYALLAHHRRRLILRIVQDFPSPLSIVELGEILTDCEYENATDRKRQHVLLSLYHVHLPKLTDRAVLDYDREDGTIRADSNFGVLVGMLTDDCEEVGSFTD